GYWAIETDVHKTKDGVLVCNHDATIDHMFNGSGEIRAMSWAELSELRFREENKNGSKRDEGMPTFRQYLEICQRHHAVPFIETKTMDVAEVLEQAFEYFEPEQVVLSSVNMEHLRLARRYSDRVFIHHIFSDETSIKELARMKPAGVSLNYPDLDAFDSRWVDVVHGYGLKLCLRAGDSKEKVERMKALGLDYVPTNCFKPEEAE
ncbi:MAG: hypothetical protein IJE71_08850, partial [Clostridia bacterium]|nr:hypothetical protein [Clostridia bacterium]